MQFELEHFYQSITQELLNKSAQFAKEITIMSEYGLNIVMQ